MENMDSPSSEALPHNLWIGRKSDVCFALSDAFDLNSTHALCVDIYKSNASENANILIEIYVHDIRYTPHDGQTPNKKNIWWPSGKRLHSYGKSPLLMGKLTISIGQFSIAMLNYTSKSPFSIAILVITKGYFESKTITILKNGEAILDDSCKPTQNPKLNPHLLGDIPISNGD